MWKGSCRISSIAISFFCPDGRGGAISPRRPDRLRHFRPHRPPQRAADMSPCCEFVTYGKVEFSPDGNVSLEQARCALLPNNPRRCLQTEIILTSCNAHKHGPFVTTNRFTGEVVDKATAGPCPLDETETGVNVATSHSTDFVLRSGMAELFSNNGRCSHFVISNGLCSAPLTSADLIWMEGVAGVPKGTLFKAFRDQQKSSPSELSYDPGRCHPPPPHR